MKFIVAIMLLSLSLFGWADLTPLNDAQLTSTDAGSGTLAVTVMRLVDTPTGARMVPWTFDESVPTTFTPTYTRLNSWPSLRSSSTTTTTTR